VSSNPFKEIDARIIGEIYTSDETMKNLRMLCDELGHRFAGSRSERKAAEFLVDRLNEYGLSKTHIETFSFPGWKRGGSPKLNVIAPMKKSIPCIALPNSPATSARGVEGELLNLGDGSPEDFAKNRKKIRGKIVLVNSKVLTHLGRWVHRVEKFGRAAAAGAKAFLFANHYDGLLPATGALRFGRKAEIPGVGLAKEDAAALARLAEGQTLRIRLVTNDKFFRASGCNVIADIPSASDEGMVIVGGHFDGHDISTGASDNAAGVATILEAARLLAQNRHCLKRTIRVALWSAEEVGLLGSQAYVRKHRKELGDIRLYFNVDALPAGKAKGVSTCGWPESRRFLEKAAEQMCYALPIEDKVSVHSDHYSFFLEGVPAACLANSEGASGGRGYGHTAADTFDKVELRDMQESAEVTARLLLRVSNAKRWPLKHHDHRWAMKQLEAANLITALKQELSPPFDRKRK